MTNILIVDDQDDMRASIRSMLLLDPVSPFELEAGIAEVVADGGPLSAAPPSALLTAVT